MYVYLKGLNYVCWYECNNFTNKYTYIPPLIKLCSFSISIKIEILNKLKTHISFIVCGWMEKQIENNKINYQ